MSGLAILNLVKGRYRHTGATQPRSASTILTRDWVSTSFRTQTQHVYCIEKVCIITLGAFTCHHITVVYTALSIEQLVLIILCWILLLGRRLSSVSIATFCPFQVWFTRRPWYSFWYLGNNASKACYHAQFRAYGNVYPVSVYQGFFSLAIPCLDYCPSLPNILYSRPIPGCAPRFGLLCFCF